jgi:general secretion pathway protein L
MKATPIPALEPARDAPARGALARLLVFLAPRRDWPAQARGALGATTEASYVGLDADGRLVEQGAAPLARLPRARAVELVFDALDVYSATIEAPRLGEAKLRQALPNLLEERMLGDPADCHCAATPSRDETGAAPAAAGGAMLLSVAAIERTTLTRALEALQQVQRQPRAAYSALYTLPRPRQGEFGVRLDGGRIVLRSGADEGCVFDLDAGAGAALILARRQLGITALRVYEIAGAADSSATWAALQTLGVPLQRTGEPVDAAATAEAVNLLQGAFASATGYGPAGLLLARLAREGGWKAPAAWAGLCLAIAVGGLNAYWFKLDSQFQELRGDMKQAFRDAFPNEPPVDELAQARRNVAALRARAGRSSAEDFTVLNAQASQLLAGAPVGVVAGIDYDGTSFRLRFLPGSMDGAAQRNALQARALALGLDLRFGADGAVQLAPASGAGD